MPIISPDFAREEIVKLLNDMVYEALGLKEALAEERNALQDAQMQGLGDAVKLKAACVDALTKLDDRRDALCRSWDFASGSSQMQAVIEWCDDGGLVGDLWDHLMVIAAESNAMNLTNGAAIRARAQQIESSLAVLRGKEPGVGTYGRQGESTGDLGQQSLAQA